MMEPILSFRSPQELRAWLEVHHDQEEGVWLVFYKDGRPTLTFREALEEAFCFGWVDSLLKSVDETRYRLKFSKRRKKSKWQVDPRGHEDRKANCGVPGHPFVDCVGRASDLYWPHSPAAGIENLRRKK
jgi:hypothetical protein